MSTSLVTDLELQIKPDLISGVARMSKLQGHSMGTFSVRVTHIH